jgi:hypothetical protein
MSLPLHTRAAALVAALSTSAAVIVTVAEIGHPAPDGQGLVATLLVLPTMASNAWAPSPAPPVEQAQAAPVDGPMPQP